MTDKPVTTYVVSVFEQHWRTVLTTKDKAKAFGKEIGDGFPSDAFKTVPVRQVYAFC